MSAHKSSFGVGAIAILAMSIMAQPQQSWAQPAAPAGIPEETLTGIVNQVSDSLVNKLTTGTCDDLTALLTKVQNSGTTPADPSSPIEQVMQSVKTNAKLKGIVVSKVGGPLINKLFECNKIPADLLSGSRPSTSFLANAFFSTYSGIEVKQLSDYRFTM
jgi:hypothetical protein